MLPFDHPMAQLRAGAASHDEIHHLLTATHEELHDSARVCDRDGNDDARETHNEVRLTHQARYPGCTYRWWEQPAAHHPGGGTG